MRCSHFVQIHIYVKTMTSQIASLVARIFAPLKSHVIDSLPYTKVKGWMAGIRTEFGDFRPATRPRVRATRL